MSEASPYVEESCEFLHDAYEEAARKFNWSTQMKSRVPWSEVPEANKNTMREAVEKLLNKFTLEVKFTDEGPL